MIFFYLESLELGVAPDFFVMCCHFVDCIDNNKVKKSVVNLFSKRPAQKMHKLEVLIA